MTQYSGQIRWNIPANVVRSYGGIYTGKYSGKKYHKGHFYGKKYHKGDFL